MSTSAHLQHEARKVLRDVFSMNTTSLALLSHFSPDQSISIQHSYSTCLTPNAHRFTGRIGVRSYFDVLMLHFEKSPMTLDQWYVDESVRRVVLTGSVEWTWRKSRQKWKEVLTCSIDFDANLKVVSLMFITTSDETTCVMQAVDPGRT